MLRAVLICSLATSAFSAGWTPKHAAELIKTAKAIGAPGKGILAADESTGTIAKRFASINTENTEANRQKYRQLLFKTPKLEEYISGVILYEETLYQKTDEGTPFPELLKGMGILTGIKVRKDRPYKTFLLVRCFTYINSFVPLVSILWKQT
jgi:hypothetical protein